MTSTFSAGGVSVRTRRLGGGGVADRSGALRDQQRPGLHRGPGGEAPEEARGLREVHRHVGGALLRAGAPHHGILGTATLQKRRCREVLNAVVTVLQLELMELRKQQQDMEDFVKQQQASDSR